MNAETEAGYILLIVSGLAWVAGLITKYVEEKRIDRNEWRDYPARHRDVVENVRRA